MMEIGEFNDVIRLSGAAATNEEAAPVTRLLDDQWR